jgi:hypothetical protein
MKDLKMIHALADAGLSNKKVSEIAGRSTVVVALAIKSKDMDEYKKNYEELASRYWRKKTPKKEVVEQKKANGEIKTFSELVKTNEKMLLEITKLNKNLETLGTFIVQSVNKQTLKKNKFFNIR